MQTEGDVTFGWAIKKKSTYVLGSGSTVCDLGDMMYSSSSTIRPAEQVTPRNEKEKKEEEKKRGTVDKERSAEQTKSNHKEK